MQDRWTSEELPYSLDCKYVTHNTCEYYKRRALAQRPGSEWLKFASHGDRPPPSSLNRGPR